MEEKKYSHREVMQVIQKIELENAIRKIPYWKSCGTALLSDNSILSQKWEEFVEKSAYGCGNGVCLDETLQILGLIKAGLSYEKINNVISNYGNAETIITYLSAFVSPEILEAIRKDNTILKR